MLPGRLTYRLATKTSPRDSRSVLQPFAHRVFDDATKDAGDAARVVLLGHVFQGLKGISVHAGLNKQERRRFLFLG